MFNTAALLADDHSVDLMIVDENKSIPDESEEVEKQFDRTEVFAYPQYRFYSNTLSGIFSRKPLQTHYFQFDDARRWVDANVEDYDLVYCNHVRTTEYVRDYDLTKVVDLVDSIARNYASLAKNGDHLWRPIYTIESRRLKRYEQQVIECFDHSFLTTAADKNYIFEKTPPEGSVSIVPNGVRKTLLERPRVDGGDTCRIGFLGKMDYVPNADAARYFATDVFPHVRSEHPNAEFVVIGANPTERVRKLSERDGVQVTGYVDDPIRHLDDAHVVVAPLRHGAGIQNKVLEAMALGKPVVSTELAREGIDAIDRKHLRVADGVHEFAQAVTTLLEDESARDRMGRVARELIRQKYTWEGIAPSLRDPINSLLSSRSNV